MTELLIFIGVVLLVAALGLIGFAITVNVVGWAVLGLFAGALSGLLLYLAFDR